MHEPTIAEPLEILKGLRSRYENHHHVTITDGALQSAAELSSRYIQDRNLPDKAIDLIDEAGARLRIKRLTAPPELKELDQKVAKVAAEKDKAIKDQDFEKAAQLRDIEKNYQEQVEIERDEWHKQMSTNRGTVTEAAVARSAKCDVLVLDDLGKEDATEWSVGAVFSVLDARYEDMRPTIVTSNYAPGALADRLARRGERVTAEAIASRISQTCRPVYLGERDRRRLG